MLSDMKFSVLMSVYVKDNPLFFRLAVDSVFSQTMPPNEVVIVKDGRLTSELEAICADLTKDYINIRLITLSNNVGLGLALQYGINECHNDLIARMDSDDICLPNRFEMQLQEFAANPKLVVCGGYIREFVHKVDDGQNIRRVPIHKDDIYDFGKKRNPFNHMTVMLRKNAVISVGNYQPYYLMEDYYLWFRLMQAGADMLNIPQILVNVRVGDGMYGRRGGLKYFFKEAQLYREFYRCKYINSQELISNLAVRFVGRIIPNGLRAVAYNKLFRKTDKLYANNRGRTHDVESFDNGGVL